MPSGRRITTNPHSINKAKLVAFAVVVLGSVALIPVIEQDFFPHVNSGQMEFHVRPPVGTRIES